MQFFFFCITIKKTSSFPHIAKTYHSCAVCILRAIWTSEYSYPCHISFTSFSVFVRGVVAIDFFMTTSWFIAMLGAGGESPPNFFRVNSFAFHCILQFLSCIIASCSPEEVFEKNAENLVWANLRLYLFARLLIFCIIHFIPWSSCLQGYSW